MPAQGQLCSESSPPPPHCSGSGGLQSGPASCGPSGLPSSGWAWASRSPWAAKCHRGQGRVSGEAVVPPPCPGLSEQRHEDDSESKDAGVEE